MVDRRGRCTGRAAAGRPIRRRSVLVVCLVRRTRRDGGLAGASRHDGLIACCRVAGGVALLVGTSFHGTTIGCLVGRTTASGGSGNPRERSRTVSDGSRGRARGGTRRGARAVANRLDDGISRRQRRGIR